MATKGHRMFYSVDLTTTFHIVAVSSASEGTEEDDPSVGVEGIIRMSAHERNKAGGRNRTVTGICVPFAVGRQDGVSDLEIRIPSELTDLFFYGTLKEVETNYLGPCQARDVSSFLVRSFAQEHVHHNRPGSGFYHIPYLNLNLSKEHALIAQKMYTRLTENLPEFIDSLSLETIPSSEQRTPNYMKGFSTRFSHFPSQLRELALARGSYYLCTQYQTKAVRDMMYVPSGGGLVVVPFGGDAGWKRKFRRA